MKHIKSLALVICLSVVFTLCTIQPAHGWLLIKAAMSWISSPTSSTITSSSSMQPDGSVSEILILADIAETGVIRSNSEGGEWNDPDTWDQNRIPTRFDSVIVSSGSTVTLAGNSQTEAGSLLIEAEALLRGGDEAELIVHQNVQNDGNLLEASESFPMFLVRIYGHIVNHGHIRSAENESNWNLIELDLFGNVVNTGDWYGIIRAYGDRRRRLDLRGVEASLAIETDGLSLHGDNYFPESVRITGDNRLIVTASARLFLKDMGYLNIHEISALVNNGQIIVEEENTGLDRAIRGYGFQTSSSDFVDTRIITFGNQVPPGFAMANTRWFRFEPIGEPEDVIFWDLYIDYSSADIGGNVPEQLEIFYSPDSGETWMQISNDENRTNNFLPYYEFGEGRIFMTDPPGYGDYVLAISDPHVPRPVVGLYVNSNDEIRVGGPPHIADITYYNPGNIPIPHGLLEITITGGAYIESITPIDENFSFTSSRTLQIDDFAFDRDSTEAMLITPVLGAGESRRLRLILQALPIDPEAENEQIAAPPAILIWGGIAFGMGTGYLQDVFTNGLENILADPCNDHSSLREKVNHTFDQTQQQWNPLGNAETPVWQFAKNGAAELAKDAFPRLVDGLSTVGKVKFIQDIGKAVVGGSKQYEQNTGRSVFEPIDCDPDPKRPRFPDPNRNGMNWSMTPVTSWDPNRKVGPVGAGSGEFIAEAGRFFYRIDFENLDEATAPAYRVVITDTLQAVYDPETVQLEGESHPGFEFSRNGNILRWEVVGIELPPNVNPPEGEGWVSFSVDAVPGQASGTIFENRATIVFDLNPPIITNTHVNILDNLPPVTQMVPLPEVVATDSLTVYFNSDDGINGSGVYDVVLFASHEGGTFSQIAISDTSFARIAVQEGTWSFYALASDFVGNAEVLKPEVITTRVVTPTSITDNNENPYMWSLGSNYPNPFNPETLIPYSLQQSGDVKITVYDVLGRRVFTMNAGRRDAGRHVQQLNMRHLASGTYLYELRVTNAGSLLYRNTAKMIMVK